MPDLEHLPLIRLAPLPERRKRPGFGSFPPRDFVTHGQKIKNDTEEVLSQYKKQPKRGEINPALILRVHLNGTVTEEEWERAGFIVLADDPDKTLILFSSDEELSAFRERVGKYTSGPVENKPNPPYAGFVASIESISSVGPKDRIGVAARAEGFCDLEDFDPASIYTFDISLWDLGHHPRIDAVVSLIDETCRAKDSEIVDRYLGSSLLLLRVRGTGALFQGLLQIPEIAEIDLPPVIDVEAEGFLDFDISDIQLDISEAENHPIIGIVDSGIVDHPILQNVTLAAHGFPKTLQTADVWGHGTKVSGIAVYGNIRSSLEEQSFTPKARIVSAKVVNDRGQFPDDRLVVNQMRDCISTLNREYGIRIFNLSLADTKRVFDGTKPGPWAAALDELIRELDIVIVVSAGNRRPPTPQEEPEHAVTEYPKYLLDDNNRLYDPATSALSITVGAIAHGNGLPGGVFDAVNVRPITGEDQPAPFTRVGFGVQGSIKPDFCDYGGTHVFDGVARNTKGGEVFASAGVLVPDHDYLQRLFTAGSATSFAAPQVTFKAAHVLKAFPDASGNLVRALLANGASLPQASVELLQSIDGDACHKVLGYGLIDPHKAVASDNNRVVLYAEEELSVDHFAVFEVPIPEEFQTQAGERWIKATLAFDPPVRHTRLDYLGINMSFRLVRGWSAEQVFEHFRKRAGEEGRHPDLPSSNDCNLLPKKNLRDSGTLQSGLFTMKRNVPTWGDTYYLVVRAEGGWASNFVTRQSFAVVVEIGHKAELPLHARIKQRVSERVRARV